MIATAPEPVWLVVCVLKARDVDGREILAAIEERFGSVVREKPFAPFLVTNYYADEMGDEVQRGFFVIEGWFDPSELPTLKLWANDMEERWIEGGRRKVNIDPALLGINNLVIASCKKAGHRVYVNLGVYAEVEYMYICGSYQPLPWTYPDYKHQETIDFFNEVREDFKGFRKNA